MKIERVGEVVTAEISEVTKAEVISLRPGDILAFKTESNIGLGQVADLYRVLKEIAPPGVEVVILAEGDQLQVIRNEDANTSAQRQEVDRRVRYPACGPVLRPSGRG